NRSSRTLGNGHRNYRACLYMAAAPLDEMGQQDRQPAREGIGRRACRERCRGGAGHCNHPAVGGALRSGRYAQTTLQQQISSLIDLGTVAVDTLLVEGSIPTYVAHGASVADVRAAALGSGHL